MKITRASPPTVPRITCRLVMSSSGDRSTFTWNPLSLYQSKSLCIGRFLIACTRLLLYRTTVLPFYRVLPCFTGFYRVLPWCYRGSTAVESRKRQETRPRRPPHGAHAARAPTKQQGHETPHCTARPRSPITRSKTVYMKSAAPIPDAMKLLWEVLRR